MSTAYLDTCCRVLETQKEYPTDDLLVNLVRIQQLAQSISLTFAFRNNGVQVDLPVNIIVKSFQGQVESFKSLHPPELKESREFAFLSPPAAAPNSQQIASMVSQIHIAEILLYEIGLQDPQPGSFLSPTDRLELLWSCMTAAKEYLTNKLGHPLDEAPRFLCLSSLDFMYVLLAALKLMTLQTPGWDPRRVRKELQFDEVMGKLLENILTIAERRKETHPSCAHLPEQEDPFGRLARRLYGLKAHILADLDSIVTPTTASSQLEFPASAEFTDITQSVITGMEESSWPDLFNPASWDSATSVDELPDFWALTF